jgi:hypothetical protein
MEAMFFPEHSRNLVHIVLPQKVDKDEAPTTDPYEELAKSIASVIFPATTSSMSSLAGSCTDLSVVFIDIASFDVVRKTAAVIDFPNRMVVTHANEGNAPVQYVYQTVGGIYKHSNADSGDSYICRSFSRERFSGNFFLQDFCMESLQILESNPTLENLSYIDEFDYDLSSMSPAQLTFCDPTCKALSMFPCVMPGIMLSKKKVDYLLDGIVMCLNDGQREGLVGGNEELYKVSSVTQPPSYWLKIQNSMSRLDPVFLCCGVRFFSRELSILEDNHKCLSDEIITAAMSKFHQVGKSQGFFPKNCGVILPAFALKGILDTLKPNDDGQTRGQKKTAVVDLSLFPAAYELSKQLWEHENIFSTQDTWYFTILNYPDLTHWMYLAMHSGEKVYYLYDPLYRESYSKAAMSVVELYIDAEATDFASLTTGVDLNSLKHKAWRKLDTTSKAQKQPDVYSCGVLSLIAFFRATVLVSSKDMSKLANPWKCPTCPKAMKKYRTMIKALLIEEEGDPTGFVYFADMLMGYISTGGADF